VSRATVSDGPCPSRVTRVTFAVSVALFESRAFQTVTLPIARHVGTIGFSAIRLSFAKVLKPDCNTVAVSFLTSSPQLPKATFALFFLPPSLPGALCGSGVVSMVGFG
jgi:hypothetical protein